VVSNAQSVDLRADPLTYGSALYCVRVPYLLARIRVGQLAEYVRSHFARAFPKDSHSSFVLINRSARLRHDLERIQ
jgi:hypothetical protein